MDVVAFEDVLYVYVVVAFLCLVSTTVGVRMCGCASFVCAYCAYMHVCVCVCVHVVSTTK